MPPKKGKEKTPEESVEKRGRGRPRKVPDEPPRPPPSPSGRRSKSTPARAKSKTRKKHEAMGLDHDFTEVPEPNSASTSGASPSGVSSSTISHTGHMGTPVEPAKYSSGKHTSKGRAFLSLKNDLPPSQQPTHLVESTPAEAITEPGRQHSAGPRVRRVPSTFTDIYDSIMTPQAGASMPFATPGTLARHHQAHTSVAGAGGAAPWLDDVSDIHSTVSRSATLSDAGLGPLFPPMPMHMHAYPMLAPGLAPNSSSAVGGVSSAQASIQNLSMTNPHNPASKFTTSGAVPVQNHNHAMATNNNILWDEFTRPRPINFLNDIRFQPSGMSPDTLLSNESMFLHRWAMKPNPPHKHVVATDEKKRYQSHPAVAFGQGFLGNQLQDPAFIVSTLYQTPPFTTYDRQPDGIGAQF